MPKRVLVNPCSIEGCDGLASSRGLCGKHYHRWQRHGDPLKTLYVMDSLEERFWQYVEKTESCWLWTSNLNVYGYGTFHLNGRPQFAHRIAYEWLVGPIPEGLQLDHVLANGCVNKNCVKAVADEFGIAHLEAVTPRENSLRSSSPPALNAKKTECPKGHPLSGGNLIIKKPGPGKPNGGRECRECDKARKRESWHRNKEKVA